MDMEYKPIAEKERFLEISKRIFYDFYSIILQDYHSSQFFQSYHTIEHLVQKQSEALYKILSNIQQGNVKNVVEALKSLAIRHFDIGINHKIMFYSIEVYTNLLRDFKKELKLEEFTILTLKELMEKTTAEEYIKRAISDVFNFIENGTPIRGDSKYDLFFEEAIKNKIKHLLDVFAKSIGDSYDEDLIDADKAVCSDTYDSLYSHIECEVGQFLHGIGFDIMSFGNENLKLQAIAHHKLIHDYIEELIKYYESGQYSKALSITSALVNHFYKLIYDYKTVSKYWDENKEKLTPTILSSKKYKNKLFFITITPSKKISKNCALVIEALENLLMRYSADFGFLYFTRVEESFYIFSNQDYYRYKESYEKLLEDIELLANELQDTLLDLKNQTIFYVYKTEIENMLDLSREEIEEMLNLLKDEAKSSGHHNKSPIVIVDIEDRKHELLKKAREEIEIRNVVLRKVLDKDIDIFIQWIYDISLNKRFFEILARVKKGDEYIPAYKFINILQRENAMINLDIAVITNVIKNIDKIKTLTNEFYMNIYPPSLNNDEAVRHLKELIKVCNEKDIILNLELTEYAITANKELFKDEDIEKRLFYIAFDDFGTGYTNYELVGEFADSSIAKTLKVDGSIVKRILTSNTYASIVESITMFSKKLGLRVIYEFIDSEELVKAIKDISKSIGISEQDVFLQGFYLHKPSSLEEEYEVVSLQQV